nr:MAG TPA: hypothetical protein [Herelleviridae sp.]
MFVFHNNITRCAICQVKQQTNVRFLLVFYGFFRLLFFTKNNSFLFEHCGKLNYILRFTLFFIVIFNSLFCPIKTLSYIILTP